MSYIFILSVFLLIILLSVVVKYFKRVRNKKLIKSLRSSWGKQKEAFYSSELIQQYFFYKNKVESANVINDQICNDLDFQELFNFTDRTTSIVGQQYLYEIGRASCRERV